MAALFEAIVRGLARVNPTIFTLGPFTVRWYGVAYLLGFVVGYFIIRYLNKRWKLGMSSDDLLTLLLILIVVCIVCSRLFYCVFYNPGYYWSHPLDVFKTWDGGMSFHGSIIGGVIALAIASRQLKQPFLRLADLCVVALPFGVFLGRIANFINGELWGRVTTVAWGLVFPGAGSLPRHPSALYEALLEGLLLFVIMLALALRRHLWPRGFMAGTMMTLYGMFRIFSEFFRQPDVQVGKAGFLWGTNWLTMGMLLSVPMIIVGVAFMFWAFKHGDEPVAPFAAPAFGKLDAIFAKSHKRPDVDAELPDAGNEADTDGNEADTVGEAGTSEALD
ncbi:MAG: prolipoprotein diacylglyceryl transferase [Coriobacteriia bacterium]|nr:prolipoprotein diacylglyceryl transferase [Coriobacteriia bacterium]